MEHFLELNWTIKGTALNPPRGTFLKTDFIQTTVPNLMFNIYFYPNGHQQPNGAEIVIYAKSDSPVDVQVAITTPSMPNNAKYQFNSTITKFDNNMLYGTTIFLPINFRALEEVFKTNQLTLQFRGSLKKHFPNRKLPFENNPLREILWNNSGKDFTLVIGDKELKVHKFLMTARSPYFEALLNSAWKENQENKVNGFKFELVEKAVKFIYDFPLIFTSKEEAFALFNFGDYYNINDLKREAETYLIAPNQWQYCL